MVTLLILLFAFAVLYCGACIFFSPLLELTDEFDAGIREDHQSACIREDHIIMNNTYPISTLRDTYNLPTIEQMKVCLGEMTEVLLQGGQANDAVMAVLEEHGAKGLRRALEWPEVTNWVDDGKGENHIKINFPNNI